MYKQIITFLILSLSFSFLTHSVCLARDVPKPKLMLANTYSEGVNLGEYWVSEKLDGVRAFWDGDKLISRGGNIYHAPKWFIQDFPKLPLDGELWTDRQQFEKVVSTVRDTIPDDLAWKQVKFMVFDMPDANSNFDQRLFNLKKTLESAQIPWLQIVHQWKVKNHQILMEQLKEYTHSGAEGLMLHKGTSLYKAKRNGDLLKVKPYQDAEALVLKHVPGKGKYKGMLGALIVKTDDKRTFKIGTGFSDKERQNPPKIGSTITYQYHGKTKNGIPRFASFLRIRKIEK